MLKLEATPRLKMVDKKINYSLNAICPYFTMFPLTFPLSILKTHASSKQWVLDPFCGRGTTNYASRCLGLPSMGIDSSPVAIALSQAKLANSSPWAVVKTAKKVLDEILVPREVPDNEFWNLAYHKNVLRIICRLREGLMKKCLSDSRKALRAILMGALHGPVNKSEPSYLSNQNPRTYAPKPRYAVNFWKKHMLLPKKVDVIEIIRQRAKRYYSNETHAIGQIIQGDSCDGDLYSGINTEFNWVITSPPYYGMRTYIPDQWLRLWFLGGKSTVDYSTQGQINHSNSEIYVSDLKKVWKNVGSKCAKGARLVIRFGGINSKKVDPLELLRKSLKNSGWTIVTIKKAGSAAKGKRQSLYFLHSNKESFQEYDLWAMRES